MAREAIEMAQDLIEARASDGIKLSLSELLLLSIANDTREMLLIARNNQAYIEHTMKEMEHDGANAGIPGWEDEAGTQSAGGKWR